MIEQCYSLRDRYERVNNQVEVERMTSIAEKAHEYRSELQKLLDLDFDNPSAELKEFAKNNNMNLKDKKVQKYFLEIRKNYLADINKFYEKNFLGFNSATINKKSTTPFINTGKKTSINIPKNSNLSKSTSNTTTQSSIANNPSTISSGSKNNKEEKQPSTEREFLKKKVNDGNSLIVSFKKNISPPIFFGVLFVALILYIYRNN